MQTLGEDTQAKNPTELLRDQVVLLNEVKQSLLEIQKLQHQVLEGLKELYRVSHSIWERQKEQAQVNVTDVHMSLGAMVEFMIKWAIAAIPAVIVLSIVAAVLLSVLSFFINLIGS